ncbi:NOP5NT-domain-containing protein, partial [Rozella allomycis CSF55]
MIVLYESPAGLALFKVLNESKLATASDLHAEFATPKKASEMVQLLAFNKFNNTAEALSSATAIAEGSISKEFKSFLKSHLKNSKETLLVADPKLATSIAKKFEIKVASDSSTL